MAIDPDVQVELDADRVRLDALEAAGVPAGLTDLLTAFNLRLEAVEAVIQGFDHAPLDAYVATYGDTYG